MATIERSLSVERGAGVRWFRWIAIATPVLILVQATLAGQFLFPPVRYPHLRDDHEMLGSLIILVIVAQLILAVRGRPARNEGMNILAINIAIMVLAAVQIALGYASRSSAFAASLHIPNGVLLFGVAVTNAVLVARPTPNHGRSECTRP